VSTKAGPRFLSVATSITSISVAIVVSVFVCIWECFDVYWSLCFFVVYVRIIDVLLLLSVVIKSVGIGVLLCSWFCFSIILTSKSGFLSLHLE
jgi:hypothetical protein